MNNYFSPNFSSNNLDLIKSFLIFTLSISDLPILSKSCDVLPPLSNPSAYDCVISLINSCLVRVSEKSLFITSDIFNSEFSLNLLIQTPNDCSEIIFECFTSYRSKYIDSRNYVTKEITETDYCGVPFLYCPICVLLTYLRVFPVYLSLLYQFKKKLHISVSVMFNCSFLTTPLR